MVEHQPMVTTINASLDDDTADGIRAVKDSLGLTWPEFLEEAADCLAERADGGRAVVRPSSTIPEGNVEELRGVLPGTGKDLEGRVAAILSMYDHLREHGAAEKGDLLQVVDVDATGYSSAESFWTNAVKASSEKPNALALLPPVTLEGDTYRYG